MVLLVVAGLMTVSVRRRLQEQSRDQCDDQGCAEQIEGVAEAEDEGLLLDDLADRDIGVVGGVNAIDHAMAHEILRELIEPDTGRLLEHRDLLREHI